MYEVLLYQADGTLKTDLTPEQINSSLDDNKALLWVDIKDPQDSDIDILTDIFKLHPLTVEDCLMPNARPKIEKFQDYLFIIAHAIELHPNEEEEVKIVELNFCLGKNFLVTVHNDDVKSVAATKERIRKQSPIITQGMDFLLCYIIDTMVDNYFPIINMFDDRGDDMSDELFKDPSQETLNKIYNLKNEIMFLRRTVGPQADMINLILRGDFDFITPANIAYFRNVYDNLIRLNDVIGTSRDTINSALEVYISVISNKMNEIMKTLTIIATIMMPLTLIASIYGMNFRFMPEISNRYAYPAVLGLMLFVAGVMLLYFKRKKWL
ncbi:MAG: magnesium/cobalt transporter CorA [Candidatus Omnitrophota bacterium]